MRILFNDVIQYSNAPRELKSPMLSETYNITNFLRIVFDKPVFINCFGFGNANITHGSGTSEIEIEFDDNEGEYFEAPKNGLYMSFYAGKTVNSITVIGNGYIGRFAAGRAIHIPTSIPKEPGFASTSEPRVTLSGQTIPGLGGYNYRTLSLDSRYKIGELAMNEIQEGYNAIGAGYPFFIDLTDESYKLPFTKLYAAERSQRQMSFEGGINKYSYSRRWQFEERF